MRFCTGLSLVCHVLLAVTRLCQLLCSKLLSLYRVQESLKQWETSVYNSRLLSLIKIGICDNHKCQE